MKIIHVPFCYYPDSVGGTEVYVADLARELQVRGTENIIAAPGGTLAAYDHGGLRVRRFAVGATVEDLRDQYGEGDCQSALEFGTILDAEHPQIVHLHALTRAVSLRLVREAKRRHIPVVFTYHTPTVSCQRGTLLRWNSRVCDGLLDVDMCTRCALHALGAPRLVATAVARLPAFVGNTVRSARASGRVWTALRMGELVRLRHESLRTLLTETDHIIVLCQWSKDLLIRNRVAEGKVTLLRHGLPSATATGERDSARENYQESLLRIAMLGRYDRSKGFEYPVRAIRNLPGANVRLDVFGVVQGDTGRQCAQWLRALASGDRRIRFMSPVASGDVIALLNNYDLVAVPSQVLETGPLVVLEAFAAGIPVIGSNLGGIAELVQNGVNGVLVEPRSQSKWQSTLESLVNDAGLVARFKAAVRPPRGMGEVATEVQEVYSVVQRY